MTKRVGRLCSSAVIGVSEQASLSPDSAPPTLTSKRDEKTAPLSFGTLRAWSDESEQRRSPGSSDMLEMLTLDIRVKTEQPFLASRARELTN